MRKQIALFILLLNSLLSNGQPVYSVPVQSNTSATNVPMAIDTGGTSNDDAHIATIRGVKSLIAASLAPVRSYAMQTRVFTYAFKPSSTRDVIASYSIKILNTVALGALTMTGQVFLEISTDSSSWITLSQIEHTQSLAILLALTLNSTNTYNISGFIPMNYYARLRTNGTATFTYISGQELKL